MLGILLGRALSGALAEYAGWVGAALLGGIGLWTLLSALRNDATDQRFEQGVTSWTGLLVLAFGLSLDNLIVGVGLGLRGLPPVSSAAIIAGSVFVFILLGLRLGSAARRHWERRAHVAAGVLLLALAGAMGLGWL